VSVIAVLALLAGAFLHESYRLEMSEQANGVTGEMATRETDEAFSFAARTYAEKVTLFSD
jgi:hypothetical protein